MRLGYKGALLPTLGLVMLCVEACVAFTGIGSSSSFHRSQSRAHGGAGQWSAQLDPGSTVAVVGASSRIGKCVAEKLLQDGRFDLKLIAASPDGVMRGNSNQVQWFLGNMAQKDFGSGINLLELSGETGLNGQRAGRILPAEMVFQDAKAVIIADTTTTFPNEEWLLGRAPAAVDVRQVSNVVQSLGPQVEHIVFLSCMGAKRELPLLPKLDPNILFWVLDRFGALSAKRQGEQLVLEAAKQMGFKSSIVRPKLHCYETGWAGGLPQDAFAQLQYEGVQLIPGDLIDGETSDQTAAEALVQCLSQRAAENRDFCVTNTRGAAPSGQEAWDAMFQGLEGLERELAESLR